MHFYTSQAFIDLEQKLETLSEQILDLKARKQAKMDVQGLVLNPKVTRLLKVSILGAAWPQEM